MSGPTEWLVPVDGRSTTAVHEPALGPTRALFVCAHGAGAHMADAGMLRVSEELRGRGFDVVRFNFLYRELGAGRPDPMPKLKQCFAAVVERVRAELAPQRLILGGRSIGGRTASMLAAEGFDCVGVLLLAYPLHPAGQPEKLRSAHMGEIKVPVLCINGTRDALCRKDLMERSLAGLSRWSMHWLEGADHSFHVLKSSGRTDAQVMRETGEASARWLGRLAPGSSGESDPP